MLIFRYFSRELLNTLLTVTLIVLITFVGNQLLRFLNDAAAGNMALIVLGKLVLLTVPYLLGLLLPITFFIALLLTQSRFSADHELLVLKACGLTPWQQWQLSAKSTLWLMVIIAALSLWIQPKIAGYRNELLATTNTGASIQTLVPGKFQASGNGRFVFYVEKSSIDHKHIHNIFIAAKREDDSKTHAEDSVQWDVIKADNGQLVQDPKTSAEFMQVNEGQRYIGSDQVKSYQVIHFDRYLMLTRNPASNPVGNELDALSTDKLFALIKDKKLPELSRAAFAELEWRISLPLACFLLSLLAVKLGEVPPRQGRYARLLPGILVLIVYINMLFVSRSWVSSGALTPLPGIFLVHFVLLMLIVFLFIPWNQWLRRARVPQ